jgi:hypothetical protein
VRLEESAIETAAAGPTVRVAALKPELTTIRLSDVIFDEVIYPRRSHDPVLVQRYADVIEEIEAKQRFISVSTDMKLLDGKHRWLAYRKRHNGSDPDIRAFVYPVTAPHDQLELSAALNSEHGWQLSDDDKEQTAKSLFSYGFSYDRIAAALNVGKTKVSAWLSRTVKENKDKRDRTIKEMWLACYPTDEIADAVGCGKATVIEVCSDEYRHTEANKPAACHAADFDPPIYNVWKQQEKTKGSSHFGNSEVRWLDNLLYLYTKPFDVVVDPFAGGGSTIDLCKRRFRRYFVSDRKPIVEREKDIRQHDVTTGLPPLHRWKDVRLVYLDPPYWVQAAGEYSNDAKDLANMPLEQFNATLAATISAFAKKLSDAYIALIIQPTQWKAPERQFTDHVGDMLRAVKLPVDMRFSVPYESQQCTPQMVDWAKAERRCLVLTREIIVWKVPG